MLSSLLVRCPMPDFLHGSLLLVMLQLFWLLEKDFVANAKTLSSPSCTWDNTATMPHHWRWYPRQKASWILVRPVLLHLWTSPWEMLFDTPWSTCRWCSFAPNYRRAQPWAMWWIWNEFPQIRKNQSVARLANALSYLKSSLLSGIYWILLSVHSPSARVRLVLNRQSTRWYGQTCIKRTPLGNG